MNYIYYIFSWRMHLKMKQQMLAFGSYNIDYYIFLCYINKLIYDCK